jgi:hypothetical protein
MTFTVVGMVTAFLAGWLGVGKLLAGVALAALVAVALGAGFALFARLLALAPPSLDRALSRAADADTSTPTQSQRDCAKEQSEREQSHDVRGDRDGGERF